MKSFGSTIAGIVAAASLGGLTFVDGAAPSVIVPTVGVLTDDDRREERRAEQTVTAVVADAANRVFNNRGLDSLLELVARGDRERIGRTLDNAEHQDFVAHADEVARMWREKYGHNFDAAENTQALQNLGVTLSKDDQGRNRATVQFPAQGGRSAFDLRLINEGSNDWRIVLPNSVTPNNFAGRMAKSMKLVIEQGGKEKWPENRSEAYLHVTAQALHTLASETERSASGRD